VGCNIFERAMRFQCFVGRIEEVETEEEGVSAPFAGRFAGVKGAEAAARYTDGELPVHVIGSVKTGRKNCCLEEGQRPPILEHDC